MGITWGPSFPYWDLWKSLADSSYLTIFSKLLHGWWTNKGWWSASKVQVDGSSNPLNRHRHPIAKPRTDSKSLSEQCQRGWLLIASRLHWVHGAQPWHMSLLASPIGIYEEAWLIQVIWPYSLNYYMVDELTKAGEVLARCKLMDLPTLETDIATSTPCQT